MTDSKLKIKLKLIEARKKRKRKNKANITYTTSDPDLNIRHFNKWMGTDFNNPSTESPEANMEPTEGVDSSVGDTSAEGVGGVAEGLKQKTINEAKREVRRYFIRPQHIFCANKSEVISALIDIGKANCTVYTLANLEDNDDIQKLSNKDIIYYYDNEILYDKNHMKVMDYDLGIKREEKRKKIDINNSPTAVIKDIYKDRIIEDLDIESEENLFLDFDDVNAYGETLKEGKVMHGDCCICGEPYEGYGNNPEPYMPAESGFCCNECNIHFVLPARGFEINYTDED